MFNGAKYRRLESDYKNVLDLTQRTSLIYILGTGGDPPDRYAMGFRGRGVSEIDDSGKPRFSTQHRVELILTPDYPRCRPLMHWDTPIFHPNFDDRGNICIEEWYPQLSLADLCQILLEMVQYKIYNTTSPLNMDAAMWAMQHRDELPIDDRGMQTPLSNVVVTGTVPIWSQPQESNRESHLAPFCEHCGLKYSDQTSLACPQCHAQRVKVP